MQTAIVAGGSRGFGRGIAAALVAKGLRVIVLARDSDRLTAAAKEVGFEPIVADMADPVVPGRLLQNLTPDLVVLCGGAMPLMHEVYKHTWETFSTNWEVDTKSTFLWLREALLLPMKPGSHVVVVSSLAAVFGSSLSGGYAGAKRMQWLMSEYASDEAKALKLDIRIQCLLPSLTTETDLGRAASSAYAHRAGLSVDEYAKRFGVALTPSAFGQAVVDLHENPARWSEVVYQITGAGLAPIESA